MKQEKPKVKKLKKKKPIRFWRIVLLTHCVHMYTLQSQGILPSFLSILLHFPRLKL